MQGLRGDYLRDFCFICGNLNIFAGFECYLRVSNFICGFPDIFASCHFGSFHDYMPPPPIKKAPSTEVNEAFLLLSLAIDRIILPALLQFFFCINDAHRVSADETAGRDVLVNKGPG